MEFDLRQSALNTDLILQLYDIFFDQLPRKNTESSDENLKTFIRRHLDLTRQN